MLNFVCLKHGGKYSPDYVNKLYNMAQRHLTVPHRFVCFTDNTANLNPNIETVELPANGNIAGWWWKPYIFREGHFPVGDTNLYFDLDMVIVKNINNLVDYKPGQFVGLRDVGRVFRPGWRKLGSAVMRRQADTYTSIWSEFNKNTNLAKRFPGDQDWIWHLHKDTIQFFPDDWIKSYKWEIRNRSELLGLGKNSKFREVRNPGIPAETSVLAFHGYPDVHDVLDPVIVENWK
jgi:hypothetical protein